MKREAKLKIAQTALIALRKHIELAREQARQAQNNTEIKRHTPFYVDHELFAAGFQLNTIEEAIKTGE